MSGHDTPELEQRVAQLEADARQFDTDIRSLRAAVARIQKKLWPQARNCVHCGRRLHVAVGAPCPLCSKVSP